ncbi:MAG: AsmA family protein [Rhizobiales bacterium]|nr:AsmA family protein [Hyphomicrobiales bacterium]
MSVWRSPLLYLGMALILLAGAALAAPLYIDWNSYRADIEDYGRQLTGRTVVIGGDIRAQLFPWPVLWLSDVSVANPPGAKIHRLMHADEIEMRLSLAPLISGKVVVEGIRVEKPVFAFERLATGTGTWQLQPRITLDEVVDVETVSVAGIEIVDGTIVLADGRRGGSAKIEDVDAVLSAPTLAGPWRVRGLMSYGRERVSAGLTTGKIYRGSPVRFAVRLAPEATTGAIYSFDGILGDKNQGVTGRLKVRPSIRAKSRENGAATRPAMVFKADMAADFGEVRFEKIEIAPDDVTDAANLLTGQARVRLGSTIRIDTTLEASRFDVDEMTASRGHGYVFSGQVFPLLANVLGTLPSRVEGDVKLSVTSLVFGGEVLDGVKLHAEIEQDRLRINTLEGSMPGQTRGRFVGSFLPAGDASQLSGDVELNSLSLRDFVNWAAADSKKEVEKVWSGARGRLKLNGKLDVASNRTRLSDGQFTFDDARGSGNFLIAGGDQPALSARIDVDSLNIDRYAPGGLTPEAIDAGMLAGAVDLAGKAMQAGEFGLKLQADFLTLHGVTGEDIAIDIAANADGIEFRTVEIGRVGDARLDVAGLLSFPDSGVAGAITADVEAKDPRGLLRLLGLLTGDRRKQPAWVGALAPLDVKVSGEARADQGVTDSVLAVKGVAGATELDLNGRFKGDHKNWTKGDVHVSGKLVSKSAKALANLVGGSLVGTDDSAVNLTLSSTGEPQTGMALSTDIEALGAQAQFAGKFTVDGNNAAQLDGRLAILAERAQMLYRAMGLGNSELGPAAQVLSGEGALTFGKGRWSLAGLSGTAAGTAYRGDLNMIVTDGRLKLGGKVSAGKLHLPWLLGLALLPRDRTGDNVSVSFDRLESLPADLDLGLSIDRVSALPGVTLNDADIMLDKNQNLLKLKVTGRNSTRAPLELSAQFERKELELDVSGQVSGSFALAEYLRGVDGARPLTGEIELLAQFAGAGRSPSGLLSALAGKGTYELKTPVLSPLDPVKFSSGLIALNEASELDRLITSDLFTGQMPFAGAKGTLGIENGVIRFSKLPLVAEGAQGHLKTYVELASGKIDIGATLKLDTLEGLPTFEVAYTGHPRALEESRDLTSLKSFVGVNVLQKGLDKLEELQREADRMFKEETKYARERVKEQLRREKVRRAHIADERKKAEEERLRKEIVARKKAEAAAQELAEELKRREAEEAARRREEDLARKLAEEESRRLTEEAESRTRLEKHIRRVEGVFKQEKPSPSTQLTVEPPANTGSTPQAIKPESRPVDITPQAVAPKNNAGPEPRIDR